MTGVIHRLGRAREVSRAGETDKAVAQIVTLQQHANHEDNDDAGGSERTDERTDDLADQLYCGRVGPFYDDGKRLRLFVSLRARQRGRGRIGRVCFLFHLAAEIANHIRCALQEAPAGRVFENGIDLRLDVPLIRGELVGQVRPLPRHHPADREGQRESQGHGGENGDGVGHSPPPLPSHERREGEAEQHGKRQRHEDVAAEIETGDDHHKDGER